MTYPCGECGQMIGTEQHGYVDCQKWRASLTPPPTPPDDVQQGFHDGLWPDCGRPLPHHHAPVTPPTTANEPAAWLSRALEELDVIDGIVDDTHPEGDGCPLCASLDALRNILERMARVYGPPPRAALAAERAIGAEALDVAAITSLLDEHQFIDAGGGRCTCDDWTGDSPERYHNDHVARLLLARLTRERNGQ